MEVKNIFVVSQIFIFLIETSILHFMGHLDFSNHSHSFLLRTKFYKFIKYYRWEICHYHMQQNYDSCFCNLSFDSIFFFYLFLSTYFYLLSIFAANGMLILCLAKENGNWDALEMDPLMWPLDLFSSNTVKL